jgi:hypothetical protein
MKNQLIAALSVIIVLTACYVNVGNASLQASVTLQVSGTIEQENSTALTVILRNLVITNYNPNTMNIDAFVDNFVGNYSYANAITISDMHPYGIWRYGYSFSPTEGTWMGWTFQQLETLINAFHSYGWKVGLETTNIVWQGDPEYNYVTEAHPELAFTDALGQSAAVTDAGTNDIIADPFAVFTTPDATNNITAGTRLIDLYTTRLTQMIQGGLSWDFWFGTDGWNGFNPEGYYWNTQTASSCYSFSVQEETDYANWVGSSGYLPSNWVSLNQTQFGSAVIGNTTILNNWWYYWQIRFAEMDAQIKQVFINAGDSANTFHLVGSADESSPPGGVSNLDPTGLYNMSLLSQYDSVDYFYVDQESTTLVSATYALGREQAYVGALVKMQNPNLNPIIGLQPVDWLGNTYPLWEVEQEYLSQAINYVWYNGIRYQVSAPNVIMMQYPNFTGWAGWSTSNMNSLFTFINTTIASLQNAVPTWLGPTYAIPDNAQSITKAFASMNFSIAQWTWSDNSVNNVYNPEMGTILSDSTLPWSGTTKSINSQMYVANYCPITSSQSLVDLKIYSSNGKILIPMTDQYDVGDSFTISSSISTTLTINTTALGLTQPAQDYSVAWQSNPSAQTPLSSSGQVSVTLSGGADVLELTRAG